MPDIVDFEEFKKMYSERSVKFVESCGRGTEMYLKAKMRNELEPGYFVAVAWKTDEQANIVHYEEYWELTDVNDLTPDCVPDIHLAITISSPT